MHQRLAPVAANAEPLKYRPDIDGLRAVAVLAVVLYHFGLGPFGGGFVGVDIFFVISGYLIGRIVIEDTRAGRFSFLQFYERRAKRLAAPLLVVLASTLLASLVLMMPDDLVAVSNSLIASAFYYANFHFYGDADYFAAEAHLKPLLHIWSLAVEEQFYLFFPLLVAASFRLFGNSLLMLFVAALSFAGAAYVMTFDPGAAFFLLPFRAWELLLGTIVFLAQHRRPPGGSVAEGLSLVGLGLIAWSVFHFSSATPFPGLSALVPCFGAALLLWANGNNLSHVGLCLAARPMVWLGKLSYSVYLWHWPLYVFSLYYLDRPLYLGEQLWLIFLTLTLAWLTYQFVEQPVRQRANRNFRAESLLASLLVSSLLGIAAVPAILSNGFPWRLSEVALRYSSARDDWTDDQAKCVDAGAEMIRAGEVCQFGPSSEKRVLLWGDSHSTALLPSFQRAADRLGFSLTFVGNNGCPPLLNVSTKKPLCLPSNTATAALIKSGGFDVVALAANWASYGSGNWVSIRPEARREALLITLQEISDAGANALLIGQVPGYTVDVPNYLAKLSFLGWADALLRYDRTSPTPALDPAYLVDASTSLPRGTEVVWPTKLLCYPDGCRLASNSRSLYKDGGHLSASGSSIADRPLEGAIKRMLETQIGSERPN